MDEHQQPDVATGVEPVDRVLASLEEMAALPVDEHVAVFERAHVELRGALDVAPRPTS